MRNWEVITSPLTKVLTLEDVNSDVILRHSLFFGRRLHLRTGLFGVTLTRRVLPGKGPASYSNVLGPAPANQSNLLSTYGHRHNGGGDPDGPLGVRVRRQHRPGTAQHQATNS